MPQYVELPNGQYFPLKKGEDPYTALNEAQQLYPNIFGIKPKEKPPEEQPQSGFVPAFKSSASELKGNLALLAGKTGLISPERAEDIAAEEKKYQEKTFKPTEEGWTQAPLTKFNELLGGSLPYMVAPAVAGLGALAIPEEAAAAPVIAGGSALLDALGLGTVGQASAAGLAALPSVAQYQGSNLAAQMATGKSLDQTSLLNASLAAIPQTAFDIVGLKMIPGIRNIFEEAGHKITDAEAKKIAEQGLAKTAQDYLVNTGKAMGAEGLAEAGQQFFERLQAGLTLTDEDARDDYFQNFLGGAVLGGALAPIGRFGERAAAKAQAKKANEKPAEAAEAPAQPEAPIQAAPPVTPPVAQQAAPQAAIQPAEPTAQPEQQPASPLVILPEEKKPVINQQVTEPEEGGSQNTQAMLDELEGKEITTAPSSTDTANQTIARTEPQAAPAAQPEPVLEEKPAEQPKPVLEAPKVEEPKVEEKPAEAPKAEEKPKKTFNENLSQEFQDVYQHHLKSADAANKARTMVRAGVITQAQAQPFIDQSDKARANLYEALFKERDNLSPSNKETIDLAQRAINANQRGFAEGMLNNVIKNKEATDKDMEFRRGRILDFETQAKPKENAPIKETHNLETLLQSQPLDQKRLEKFGNFDDRTKDAVAKSNEYLQKLTDAINAKGFTVFESNKNSIPEDVRNLKSAFTNLYAGTTRLLLDTQHVSGKQARKNKKSPGEQNVEIQNAQKKLNKSHIEHGKDIEAARDLLGEIKRKGPKAPVEARPELSGPPPEPPEIVRAREEVDYAEKEAKKTKNLSYSLWTALVGELTPSNVKNLGKGYTPLQAGKGKKGADISTKVSDKLLDDFLPFDKRPGASNYDEQEAVEYIYSKLKSRNYITFAAEMEIEGLMGSVREAEELIQEHLKLKEINELINEAADEQREAEINSRIVEPEGEAGAAPTGAPELTLQGETPEEVRAKEKEKEDRAKAEKEAEKKAEIDKGVGEFTLTGSNRPADIAAAQGQAGLFDTEPEVKKETGVVVTPDNAKLSYPIARGLVNDGYKVLALNDPKTYVDKGGEPHRTFEKDGVRLSVSTQLVLFQNKNNVQTGMGEPDQMVINALLVDKDKRGSGLATKALQEITDQANKNGVTLYIEPAPILSAQETGLNHGQLVNLYKKFGFEFQEGSDKVMERAPQITLTGSNRPADQAAARGQEDLFGQPKVEAKPAEMEALNDKIHDAVDKKSQEFLPGDHVTLGTVPGIVLGVEGDYVKFKPDSATNPKAYQRVPAKSLSFEFRPGREPKASASKASDKETGTEKGKLNADMGGLIKLLGANMYAANIADVSVKELLQNAFDASKAAVKLGIVKVGKIDIVVNAADITNTVKDLSLIHI